MSFGDEAVPEEEPVFSEAEAADEENDAERAAEQADPREVLARERDEYLLALQRTQADFENYRKRIARQQEEQAARASQHLVEKLLPVLDALDLAENHLNESLDMSEGAKALRASRAMLMDILSREGLERVDQPEVPFDPSEHDAVAHSEGTAARAARPWWRRSCAPATAGRGRRCAPHGPCAGVNSPMAAQREWFEKDYYKVLGVVPTATDKEITRAYRKLAKEHHPDTNPGSEERFKEISAAYDVLGDTEKRKEYDEVRTRGLVGAASAHPAAVAAPSAWRTWAT